MTTAASVAEGRYAGHSGARTMNAMTRIAPTTPDQLGAWPRPVRRPECARSSRRSGNLPAVRWRRWPLPRPPSPGCCSTDSPRRAASERDSTAVSVNAMRAMPRAGPISGCHVAPTADHRQGRRRKALGQRADNGELVVHPSAATRTIEPTTATSNRGEASRIRLAVSISTSEATPIPSACGSVSPSASPCRVQPCLVDHRVAVHREAEELRDLTDDHHERYPVQVADADRFREQIGDETQADDRRRTTSAAPMSIASRPASATARSGSPPERGSIEAAMIGASAESGPSTRVRRRARPRHRPAAARWLRTGRSPGAARTLRRSPCRPG